MVRLAGTNVDAGRAILAARGDVVITADSLAEAAQMAVAAWRQSTDGRAS